MRRVSGVLAVWAIAVGFAGGCGGSTGTSGGGSGAATGRGSAACQDWQKAVCGFIVGCGAATQSTCDGNYQTIACKSDAQAASCTAKFRSATCQTPPAGCDLSDLGDPAPAVKACNDYLDAACKANERCSGTAAADCRATVGGGIDCSKAIGVGLSFETCMSELGSMSCSAGTFPTACKGSIKVSSTSMVTTVPPDGGAPGG
jgi:hypothetical protein